MKKHFKKYFIPHKENEYKPHILRDAAVLVLVLIIVGVFLTSLVHIGALRRGADFIAAVLPRVLVDLANEDRVENELHELRVNPVLEEAARLKAAHMAENSYFAHTSPDGVTPWHWFIEAGYVFTHAGENLAINFSDSSDVEQAWMNSPGHRANILNTAFTEIGIATARGEYEGQETIFVVQLFGRPAETQIASESITEEALAQETEEEASDDPEPVEEGDLEIITQDELFVAVQNTDGIESQAPEDSIDEGEADVADTGDLSVVDQTEENEEGAEARGEEATGLVPAQSGFFERLLGQPHLVLEYIYLILAGIIILALLFAIFIEIEEHHPKQVLYGVLLLALILLLIYFSRNLITTDLLVV